MSMTLAVQERATACCMLHVAPGCTVRILDLLVSVENKTDPQSGAFDLLTVSSSFPHRLLLLLSDSDGEKR
jgi:PDZ domain-containing secreted protein